MRRFSLLLLVAGLFTFSSCDKSLSQEEQLALDKETIRVWLELNQITNSKQTESGISYFVTKEGLGSDMPAATDEVTVIYKGYYTEGGIFDETPEGNTFKTFLFNVIPGWEEGIQLMRLNEKTTFLIPSYLAYGTAGRGPIPPNTVLLFDIELLDF